MGRKGLSWLLVTAGLSLAVLSVTADVIGLGASDYAFGWEQKLGVAVSMTVVWFSSLRLLNWYPFAERRVESTRDARRTAPVSA